MRESFKLPDWNMRRKVQLNDAKKKGRFTKLSGLYSGLNDRFDKVSGLARFLIALSVFMLLLFGFQSLKTPVINYESNSVAAYVQEEQGIRATMDFMVFWNLLCIYLVVLAKQTRHEYPVGDPMG